MTETERIIQRLKNDGHRFGIVLNPPSSESELIRFKDELQIELHSDIAEFYKKCNGFESDDYLFRVIPLKEIIENKSEFERGTFNFAEYLIYSDTWDLKIDSNNKIYKIVNCNHKTDEPIRTWDSLHSFLDNYLDGTGLFGEQGLYTTNKSHQVKTSQQKI